MYQASAAFHAGAMSEALEKRLLMRFPDGTIFTGEDVKGMEITYPLNEETELTMGKCVSAELRCTVLNYSGLLSGFAFGTCEALLGALAATEEWTMPESQAAVVYQYGTANAMTYAAHEEAPYLTKDGSAANAQPPFAPECLVILDGVLYAAESGGAAWAARIGAGGVLTVLGSAFTWGELSTMTWARVAAKTWGELKRGGISAFLAQKLALWAGRGLWFGDKVCYEFGPAGADRWEYVPVGTFRIDTPEKRRVANISCEALDGMQLFNVDVDDWWAALKWPLTRGQLLAALCTQVGVTLKTATFPGSDVSIPSAPIAGNGLVGKDVLGWIAETACSYAWMSRDNTLELVWFAEQSLTVTQHENFGDTPAEYETPAVEAVHVMAMSSDLGVMVPEDGSGNEYQIIDNPLLYGATEAEIREKAQPVYTRLTAFPAYVPNEVDAGCDWATEPGDIIEVVGSDGETRTLPIFRMVLRWSGGCARATYSCTGGRGRKPASAAKRREFAMWRAYHKLEVDITGIHSEIGDVKGNVTKLELTAEGLDTRISDAEGSMTTLQLTVQGLTTRVENAEGDYSTLEQTVNQLRSEISGKIDGEQAQSLIDQTVEAITLEVSSSAGSSTFILKSNGLEISTETVDLHVSSVNVDGTITADAINLNEANITGTLKGQYIDADTLHVKSANIDGDIFADNVYANNIVGGTGTSGGYVPYGAISDNGHHLASMFVDSFFANNSIDIMNNGDSDSGIRIDQAGIVQAGTRHYWSDIFAGGSGAAVFG